MKNNKIIETLKKINLKAIIIGALSDIIGSTISGGLIRMFYAIFSISKKIKKESLIINIEGEIPLHIILITSGLIFTSLGGFITGIIAKKNPIINSLSAGILLFIASLFILQHSPGTPTWYSFGFLTLTIPCAILGGFLAQKYLNKK